MDNEYIRKMQTMENQCAAYEQMAEEIFQRNGAKPCKEQCTYLQKAANLRSEMARISIGEERLYQRRRLRELLDQIRNIIREIDPDLYNRMVSGENGKPNPRNDNLSTSANPQPPVGDVDTAKWFKEMPKHSFADVSGMEELKEQLRDCIQGMQISELKAFLKMPNIHSFFFYGPPGCGKTYIIEAFAHELMDKDYTYLSLEGSDVLSKYVGDAEKTVSRVFEEAEKHAPCIIFFDEVDGVCKSRTLPDLPNYASSLTTAFLTGYNRIAKSEKPIIFIGATNHPRQVDNAMLDRVELIRVPLPDADARAAKFQRDLEGMISLGRDLSYNDMAQETEGYNYRDIDRLVAKIKSMVVKAVMKAYSGEKAAMEALKSGAYAMDKALFEEARSNSLPTPKDAFLKELDNWEDEIKRGCADF